MLFFPELVSQKYASLAVDERRHIPGVVAVSRGFHLPHFGPKAGKAPRHQGSRQKPGEILDQFSVEWFHSNKTSCLRASICVNPGEKKLLYTPVYWAGSAGL